VKRREFISLLGGTVIAWPLATRAQQMPVIGFLHPLSPDPYRLRVFRQGLKEAGFIEGENVAIEYRWADNQIDRLPALAAELVQRRVAVIATGGALAALAAKAATTTIPVVFILGEDPVRLGLVASLARPGGNLTGVNFFVAELAAKRLELLREVVPAAARIAVFTNPTNPTTSLKDVGQAARAMGLQIKVFNVSSIREVDAAFATLASERADGLFVANDPFFIDRRVQLSQLAAHHSLPRNPSRPPVCGSRRADELRGKRGGCPSASWHLHRAHSQGRQARGSAGRTADKIRVGHQRLDRADARPQRAADVARHRRRGDRVAVIFAAVLFRCAAIAGRV
jgi:putative ABC transport system substrate-binding protein